MAELVDPCCDIVLVGDSLGMVLHGLESTLGVTLEMMILHGKAVRRGLERALMVVDLPFGTYEESPQQALRTSARVMAETGCAAVKLEGGAAMAETIADRKSTRLNSSHLCAARMPSSALNNKLKYRFRHR